MAEKVPGWFHLMENGSIASLDFDLFLPPMLEVSQEELGFLFRKKRWKLSGCRLEMIKIRVV